MKAIFIDCYVKDDEVILWLKDGRNNIKLKDRFIPEIYLLAPNLKFLKNKLMRFGIKPFFKKKKSFFNNKEIYVLAIPIYRLSRYHELIRFIEESGNYEIEIYNADLKLEESYMFQKEIFPTAAVEYTQKEGRIEYISPVEISDCIDYIIPDFEVANIEVKTEENIFKTLETGLLEIIYNGVAFAGEIRTILLKFKDAFNKQDPDIIWTDHGNLVLPYLKKQFQKHSISIDFNRFESDDFEFLKGESYWTYNSIIYRTASIFLKGRLHFDTKSFLADNTGFYGIIEGARVCRQRIQRTEMRSAGAAVTNLLLYESNKRNFLLPYKVGIYERFKTLGQLYEADRGSIIFEPRIGFHNDVVELDFVSLYPQIMWKFNLSPETLFCSCCKQNKVPGLHYNFCEKERGVVSIVAENLIKRRIELKRIGTPEAKEKASYLKWLLVTMFGYQAFKNRKIGTIEIHESIQAYAREIILKTVRIAESLGWEVVHGIIDSVYIKKPEYKAEEVEHLRNEISDKTGFIIAHEGNYKWIVFLSSIINENQPVSSHFYGILENGEIKCRGIESRRKDAPKIIEKMQKEMINVLSKARTEAEFKCLFQGIFKILNTYIESLKSLSPHDLIISRILGKVDYSNNIPQKLIVEMMRKEGWNMQPGQKINYILRDVKNKNPNKRYSTLNSFDGKIDFDKYKELMVKSVFNILQPFGVSVQDIERKIQKTKQLLLEL
ncbi:hypothetical protein HYW75_02785 [Candidatus Pacearchaeota archaeon]|nr:hypothetical protein [Candidatus Pacearchaeota archaeon]